jgi:hypothetical protein
MMNTRPDEIASPKKIETGPGPGSSGELGRSFYVTSFSSLALSSLQLSEIKVYEP